MAKGIFVTGTDTGVGKTLFSGCLAFILKNKGKVAVFKPVESGCKKDNDKVISSDLNTIKSFSGLDDKDLFNLYRFEKLSSPHLASELENKNIDIELIKKKYNELIQNYNYVIVEGAGGLMVPITRDYTFSDLIKDLEIDVIVVSRSGLGTINHTSLTINHLKQNNAKLIGIVFNFFKGDDIEQDNKKIIQELNNVNIIGIIPDYGKINESEIIKNKILEDFEKNIDIEKII